MLNVSQEKVLEIEMPVPPIGLQKKFASRVWKMYGLRKNFQQANSTQNALFHSLVQRAFRGEL